MVWTYSNAIKEDNFVGSGGTCNVYRISPNIAVKRKRDRDDHTAKKFGTEADFFKLLNERQDRCADIVTCFLVVLPDHIFLSYCSHFNLSWRIEGRQRRERRPDGLPGRVLSVDEYEDPALIARWARQLSSALAYLEKMGWTHNDVHPRNCLLDETLNLKLCDFDHATKIGPLLDVPSAPWARKLNAGPLKGYYGLCGSRTEQFAFGTVVYCMVYGRNPYEDELDPFDPADEDKLQRRFQDMEFPSLDRHVLFDQLITECWYDVYPSMVILAHNVPFRTADIMPKEDTRVDIDFVKEVQTCKDLIQKGLLGPELALQYMSPWRWLWSRLTSIVFLKWKGLVNFLRRFWDTADAKYD